MLRVKLNITKAFFENGKRPFVFLTCENYLVNSFIVVLAKHGYAG